MCVVVVGLVSVGGYCCIGEDISVTDASEVDVDRTGVDIYICYAADGGCSLLSVVVNDDAGISNYADIVVVGGVDVGVVGMAEYSDVVTCVVCIGDCVVVLVFVVLMYVLRIFLSLVYDVVIDVGCVDVGCCDRACCVVVDDTDVFIYVCVCV